MNVTFLEYKTSSSYSSSSWQIAGIVPNSADGVYATTRLRAPPKPTHVRLKPRLDEPYLWHLRAGHLGPEALENLVENVKGVQIKGTERKDCESCALSHAKSVISRKPPERRSPRPFWRVAWDLQDYPEGYNGTQWLMVVKDEYSGYLWCQPLPDKHGTTVFNAIYYYEAWVRRQFGVAICILKSDNERSVLPADDEWSRLSGWTAEQGIVLELSPSETHEPNGIIERANQEVTVKSISMLQGAGLKPSLWPESTKAAVYLLNRSPKRRLG
jgi:hypothetical protein